MLKKKKIKDVSTGNVFARKFVVRLVGLTLLSAATLACVPPFLENSATIYVKEKAYSAALQTTQTANREIQDEYKDVLYNQTLANIENEMTQNPFVAQSSLSLYSLSDGKKLATSFAIPYTESTELIEWWKSETKTQSPPVFYFQSDFMNFCMKNKNCNFVLKSAYIHNNVLFPTSVSAIKKDGTAKDEYLDHTTPPSYTIKKDFEDVTFTVPGNMITNSTFKYMSDYKLTKPENVIEKPTELDTILTEGSTINTDTQDVENNNSTTEKTRYDLEYKKENKSNFESISIEYEIDGKVYQLDCFYDVNFWHGAFTQVIFAEMIGILICAFLSIINTKESINSL